MTIKFFLIGMTLGAAWNGAGGSVVGVTYRDDFDFEQRYRRVHECDPFYWHPLHLPEDCADMYEKLIRSRLPVRIPKRTSDLYLPMIAPSNMQSFGPSYYQYAENPVYQTLIGREVEAEAPRELTPYEEMLESVQKDVNNFPSVPSVKNMPNFGPVAVYQQPVSQISADMIKKVAMTYIHSSDEKLGKKRHRSGNSGSKWKELVGTVRRHERKGWKKINSGDVVSLSKH